MLDQANATVLLIGGVLGIIALIGGWWFKRGRPFVSQAVDTFDAIAGRPAERDRSGAIKRPAQPGLPAQVTELTDAVRELVKMQHRMDHVETGLADVQRDVRELKDARIERVVTQAESAAMLHAVSTAREAEQKD